MVSKKCNICDEVKDLEEFPIDKRNKDGRWGKCRVCLRQDKKRWQQSWSPERRAYYSRKSEEYAVNSGYKRDKKKLLARRRLQKAVASGKVTREPCEVCNDPNTQAHHEDYDKPLEVNWLCSGHHADLHREKEYGNAQNVDG